MLIDSHSHLNFPDTFPDLEAVKAEMTTAGVEAAIAVGICVKSSRQALDISSDWIFPSVGVHPQEDSFTDTADEWKAIEKLMSDSRVVAVGETGIDTFHPNVPLETQKKRFERQLGYARDTGLPVIVHCRDKNGEREAAQMTMDFIEKYGQGTKGVLHCFAGDPQLGQFALDRGWAISLAGNLTFKNAQDLRDNVASLKGDHFLVETDCPFLTPHPFRGKKNAPHMVPHTAKVLGEIKGWDFEETIRKTRHSTIELFKLPLNKKEEES